MKKIFSILLSIVLLSSHMFLTVGTHYCGGKAIKTKIILGETHLGCGMIDTEEPCNNSDYANNSRENFDNFPCCENNYQTIQSTSEFVKDSAQIVFRAEFALAYIFTSIGLDSHTKLTHKGNTEHITPPIEKDIQILFQTFLI